MFAAHASAMGRPDRMTSNAVNRNPVVLGSRALGALFLAEATEGLRKNGQGGAMTTNRIGVVSFVRFQLAQLRSKNGHHDFEHVCRHLARATICPRILPATGPVQAGGDQGETLNPFEPRETLLRTSSRNSFYPAALPVSPAQTPVSL